jgi:superfamily I DNA/RNA helicase
VRYDYGELDEVSLAYAISIHKSQGSEFPVVVIPLAIQQYMLLERNLLYTGVTRGKRLVMLIGEQKALQIAIRKNNTHKRHSGLRGRLKQFGSARRSSNLPAAHIVIEVERRLCLLLRLLSLPRLSMMELSLMGL